MPATAGEEHAPALDLSFSDFFAAGAPLALSGKLLGLHGRRVRLAGFMAKAESSKTGLFHLCPRPVLLAEERAGTGELPV